MSHRSHIVAKPHAVVAALGKRRHRITVFTNDKTSHVICGGPGADEIYGGRGRRHLVGGRGKDGLKGGPGRNLLVGDNYHPHGNAVGHTAHDKLIGGRGRDVLVGAAKGDDLTFGDSFSRCGAAIGGGDTINDGPGADLDIGDSATLTGKASGGGNDTIHGADGGDANARCAPHTCDDRLYGDSYALSTKARHRGTGNDLLAGDQGDNYLDGLGSKPGGGGRGKTLCAGNNTGHNVAIHCAVYKDVQKVLETPEPPPPLKGYGAPWPGRTGSPEP